MTVKSISTGDGENTWSEWTINRTAVVVVCVDMQPVWVSGGCLNDTDGTTMQMSD